LPGPPADGIGDRQQIPLPREITAAAENCDHQDRNNQRARLGLGKALINTDQTGLAIAEFKQALAADSSNIDAYNGLGVAFNLTGDHRSAENNYLDGLERAPDHLLLRNNLAMSLALGGEFSDAIQILQKVTTSPSATATNRHNLALVLGMMGRSEAAAEMLRTDLNREEVKNNLDFYRALKPLDSRQRAMRIFGVSGRP
jgi:Flp pilus assembly protein TadD